LPLILTVIFSLAKCRNLRFSPSSGSTRLHIRSNALKSNGFDFSSIFYAFAIKLVAHWIKKIMASRDFGIESLKPETEMLEQAGIPEHKNSPLGNGLVFLHTLFVFTSCPHISYRVAGLAQLTLQQRRLNAASQMIQRTGIKPRPMEIRSWPFDGTFSAPIFARSSQSKL
jgi:hypothetical protein